MHRHPTSLILIGSLFGSCAYVDPDPGWASRKPTFREDADFETEARELQGIDSPRSADRVEQGDRILYGVEFEKHGETKKWLVYVEVLNPKFETWMRRDGSETHSMLLDVRVCDEVGEEVGRDQVRIARQQLVYGLMRACRGEKDPPPSRTGRLNHGRVPVNTHAEFALRNMLKVIRESDVLFGVLWQLIDTPSIVSIITNFGVRVSLDSQFDKAEALAPIQLGGQVYEAFDLPIELRLNGTPALRCKLQVTNPDSPLNLSAGIVSIAAFQPSDPSARVTIRVLAARRGAPVPP